MNHKIGIVDLFSGPGGLGEGFSAVRDCEGNSVFSLGISIEKEASAHQTLLLRSFLRKFGDQWPTEYFDFLNGKTTEPSWSDLYPDQWAAAQEEAKCLELGADDTAEFLEQRIREIRALHGGRTVLIGGPPCQAYSLAGRSRNSGKKGYRPEDDERNFLYNQYVKVLRKLKPAVFVMENVKGMLSSAINNDGIFEKVMDDLETDTNRKQTYRLYALSPSVVDWRRPEPKDFIVRAEEFGVPQARHRVIIVGIREDIAKLLPPEVHPSLKPDAQVQTVRNVLSGMPLLRSGLSKSDSLENWRMALSEAVAVLERAALRPSSRLDGELRRKIDETKLATGKNLAVDRTGKGCGRFSSSCSAELQKWIIEPSLRRLPNNDTRGHMASDLGRYLFASLFASARKRSPKAQEFPPELAPNHKNWDSGKFSDRFRVQVWDRPASTVTSHISKDGHYFIHPDPIQCRSLTVREAARLQTFPDNYFFKGNRTQQYVQVGNAVPPYLAYQIAQSILPVFSFLPKVGEPLEQKTEKENHEVAAE